MSLTALACDVITRALFVLVSLAGVWRVTEVKQDPNYWFLTFLYLPLVVELIITLKRRRGQNYSWFCPPIFLFLISIIPSIWLLELHQLDNRKSNNASVCHHLDSWENLMKVANINEQNQTVQHVFRRISDVCSDDWILGLHQVLLNLLIVGKWLLPLGGAVTRDELSELLLNFVGTAADILEFTSETLTDIKRDSPQLVYSILAVWTLSLLQFPLHLSGLGYTAALLSDVGVFRPIVLKMDNKKQLQQEAGCLKADMLQEKVQFHLDFSRNHYQAKLLAKAKTKVKSVDEPDGQEGSLWAQHGADIWTVMVALFLQDGPFLVVRLTVMTYFNVYHQMLGFFAIKNFLVVALNLYKLLGICQDVTSSRGRRRETAAPVI